MSEIQYILLHHNISAFLQNSLLSQLLLYTPEQSETIKKLILELGSPIFMTSANQSGEPTCNSLDEIEEMCPNLDGIMEGNVIFSKGSTIIDCSSDDIKILREGPITIEQINEIVNYNLRKKVIKL